MTRLLFSTGSLYLLDTSDCFELAAEAGFDGIEIMCDDRWSTRSPAYLRHLSAQTGLPVAVVHTPFSLHLPGWKGTYDQLQRILAALRLAETLEAETLVVHLPRRVGRIHINIEGFASYKGFGPTTFGKVRRWIRDELAGVQATTPVKIALENMPQEELLGIRFNPWWWNSVEQWSQLHDHLTLDTTHWGTMGIDPLDAYQAARGRVAHVHLSNFNGQEHRLPQRGDLDLNKFLQALAADGFTGTVTVELHPDALEFTDEAALRRNLKECVAFCRAGLGG